MIVDGSPGTAPFIREQLNDISPNPIFVEDIESYNRRRKVSIRISAIYIIVLIFQSMLILEILSYPEYSQPIQFVAITFVDIMLLLLYFASGKTLMPIMRINIFTDKFSPPYKPFIHWIFRIPIYISFREIKTINVQISPTGNILIIQTNNNKRVFLGLYIQNDVKQKILEISKNNNIQIQ
jgi:hypothetical protein